MKLDIDTSQYRYPTQKEYDDAKKFIIRRENYASILESRIETILTDAAGQIAQICFKYNIPANAFTLTANEKMFQEICDVMDEAEEEILSLIDEFSTASTKDNGIKKLIALWITTLGKGNMNLRQTLEGYMNRYLYDVEAIVAAYKLAMENNPKLTQAKAISQIKSSQKSIYTNPYVISAKKGAQAAQMAARYIRTHGVHRDDVPLPIVGSSNSNMNNVKAMAGTTLRMAWMREQMMEFRDAGAKGYLQMRGSSYPCAVCDDETGIHQGDFNAMLNDPYPHPNCCCFRVPLFEP